MFISLLHSFFFFYESALTVWNLRRGATNCVCFSGDDDAEELEEGEWIPEDDFDPQEDYFDQGFCFFFLYKLILNHEMIS